MVLPKTKLHQLFFYLLILFLPTQLGKHFWPDWTRVLGLRLDYLSPSIYLTDILILGILISWIMEKMIHRHSGLSRISFDKLRTSGFWMRSFHSLIRRKASLTRMTKLQSFLFLGFLIFLLVNCFFSQNQPVAFYKLIKILEFSLLGLYLAKNRPSLSTFYSQKSFAYFLLSTSIIYSSLLAIAQFFKQGSLGGIFYWLGERSFTSGTPGIAQTVWNGELLLRSYATFPHPNVLAGFLVVSLLLIKDSRNLTSLIPGIFRWLVLILGTIALFLTFSHTAWAVFVGAITLKVLLFDPDSVGRELKNFSLRSKNIFFAFVLLLSTFYFLFSTFPIQSESITYRQDLNLAAVKMWQSSSLIGVGLNNFLVRLPEFYQSHGEIRWFQPAHNIFLMVLAETGLIGLISLIWFLILTLRRLLAASRFPLAAILVAILVLGLFDHYFYTLQQGQLIMALIFGLAWSKPLQNGKM